MRLKDYLQDKFLSIIIFISMYFIILLMLLAFKTNLSLIKAITCVIFSSGIIIAINYFRKKRFYKELLEKVELLDKAYLVLEVLTEPDFYEGQLLFQALYKINKSMNEYVKNLEIQMNDFKEYIEMWIHEVKIPLASLTLMSHNKSHQENISKEQLKRIEDYLDQVLYYVRSENAEKDYLINEVNLNKIIGNIALKNKDYLLENNIDLIVQDISYQVLSDSKWLEFIINQIINNSIKYRNPKANSYIKITTTKEKDQITLIIEDNGIGISSNDLPRVFEKSFTGTNGRTIAKSTGMGLFIAKKLCKKLGHKITIESAENSYTKIKITFPKNKFYEVIK